MKKTVSILLFSAGIALAGEYLGIVPHARPEALAGAYMVIGETRNGVLVIADPAQQSDFTARGGVYLDSVSSEQLALSRQTGQSPYYRIRLLDPGAAPDAQQRQRAQLAQLGRILDFDGEEYVVRLNPDAIPRIQALRAMLSRISLRPIVLKSESPSFPQVSSDPLVRAMVAAVSPDTILAAVRRLQNYRSRYSTGDSARAAAEWIAAKFRAYGCDSVFFQNHTSGYAPNVVGISFGTAGQRKTYAVIDGHYDSYAQSNAPGADDNASGTVSAIEACRVMRNYEFVHDVRYIAFSGEEEGLYGSTYYAHSARNAGDSIMGVFNFDMIGYVDNSPEDLDLVTKINNPPCGGFADFFVACADTYTTLRTNKQMVSDNQNSDHGPFWQNGYLAFCGIEDFWPTNPHYHTSHDSIGAGFNSISFCSEVVRAAVAALATICEPVPNAPSVGYLRNRIDDTAGNNNGRWDPGESIAVYLTLKNWGLAAAHDVIANDLDQ